MFDLSWWCGGCLADVSCDVRFTGEFGCFWLGLLGFDLVCVDCSVVVVWCVMVLWMDCCDLWCLGLVG